MSPLLDTTTRTVAGSTLGAAIAAAAVADEEVIRPLSNPLAPHPGIVIVRGSLAPDGAVVKRTVGARAIELEVTQAELGRRRSAFSPPPAPAGCGWLSVYARSVRPLGEGATLGG